MPANVNTKILFTGVINLDDTGATWQNQSASLRSRIYSTNCHTLVWAVITVGYFRWFVEAFDQVILWHNEKNTEVSLLPVYSSKKPLWYLWYIVFKLLSSQRCEIVERGHKCPTSAWGPGDACCYGYHLMQSILFHLITIQYMSIWWSRISLTFLCIGFIVKTMSMQ